MKKTFTTIMPDKVGAFLAASRIFSALALNITRVSYNKAVDTHMLFIEAEGEPAALDEADGALRDIGYLPNDMDMGGVILIEFRLRDLPGVVQPVLELIDSFRFNISYISSQADGGEYQYFRMGLFVENADDVSRFLRQAAQLCDLRIIDYDPTVNSLDNTVFYVSFANQIADKIKLNDEQKRGLIVDSNLIMEMLARRSRSPYATFDYIGKFADNMRAFRGEAYGARVSRHPLSNGMTAALIEPPCGSNICIIDTGEKLVCIDSGFPCYREETLACVTALFPDFAARPRELMLTHADVDHCGLIGDFDAVYLSRKCYDNFLRENEGRDNLRELNAIHAPYVRISKILAGYLPPAMDNLRVIGGSLDKLSSPLERIGDVSVGGLDFEVYEAAGGHVAGEVVYLQRSLRIIFTGDILVNVKGFTPQQAAFNRLAPYLMTSVDSDPALAAGERRAIAGLLAEGEWTVFGGHGAPMQYFPGNERK